MKLHPITICIEQPSLQLTTSLCSKFIIAQHSAHENLRSIHAVLDRTVLGRIVAEWFRGQYFSLRMVSDLEDMFQR